MANNEERILCPKCNWPISIDVVLTKQIEEKVKKDFEKVQIAKDQELSQKTDLLRRQEAEIIKSKNDLESTIAEKVASQLSVEKSNLLKQVRLEVEKEEGEKIALLEEQLENKDSKLIQAMKNEVELRKEKIKLEQDKQSFELDKIRQLEEERKGITEEAKKAATEEQQYIILQLKKQLTDATKAKDELARKLEQGSQQTQGEVFELTLESILKTEFPQDDISPVPKGICGADIIQSIEPNSNLIFGKIIWELKKTKSWSEGWIQKLKDDQRAIKADIAVIVSIVLPEDCKGFIFREGVWICDVKMAVALAIALRINLKSLVRERAMSIGKNEKMEMLYGYLTGIEFKQRVEAIIEAFSGMDEGLRKERMAFEKIWTEREKQIKKVMSNTIGMYGDLSGLVALPQIKQLELEK